MPFRQILAAPDQLQRRVRGLDPGDLRERRDQRCQLRFGCVQLPEFAARLGLEEGNFPSGGRAGDGRVAAGPGDRPLLLGPLAQIRGVGPQSGL